MATMFQSNAVVWVAIIPVIALENVVCLLAISTRKRWKSPDVLLFSLIMAHFLTLVLPLLLYSAVIMGQGEWRESACKFLVWSVMSFKVVNSLQICFLSMDRVWTLKWPGSYRLHNTAGQSMRTVSFIWIFGLFIGCIPLLGWPRGDPLATAVCSLILDVGGYGYSLCIVVIILGSFAVSSVCIATILFHLAFSRLTQLDGVSPHSPADFKRPIPEIVIESETGERTAAVQVSRERQNRQICILVSVMVTVEFFINGIPFVVINLMALVSDSQTDWMPISIMWCTLSVTLINPVLLGLVCKRYRRSYAKLGQCVAEACGCADGGIRDTTATVATLGGIQRQETFDSLDNFSDTDDQYGRGGLGLGLGLGLGGEPSFSIDLEDEHALDYGITASMERDIHSLEQAGILSSDAADAGNNEAYIQAAEVRNALSSGERRALWLAQKAVRQAAVNKDGRPAARTTAVSSADEPGTSAEDPADVDQSASASISTGASPALGQHRKLERNSSRGGVGGDGGEPGQTLLTIRAEIENGGLTVPRADDFDDGWAPKPVADPRPQLGEIETKRLSNGGIVGSQSMDASLTRKETKESKKSKKKRRSSVPPAKEETVGRSLKLSPVKTQPADPTGHSLRSASGKLSALRERMLSDNSTNHGSGELYDIPEEEPDEVQETSFFKGLMPPGAASRRHRDESVRDRPFEPLRVSPSPQPARTPKAGKKSRKKKGRDRRQSRWTAERGVTIDYEDNPLTREEELLKRAIEHDESSSHFAYDNPSPDLDPDPDLTDGCMSEHSGYVSSRNSSLNSRLGASFSIDASVEYDMDMIVIEHVDCPVVPPPPPQPPPTSSPAVANGKLGWFARLASAAPVGKPTPDTLTPASNSHALITSEAADRGPSKDALGDPSPDLPGDAPSNGGPRAPGTNDAPRDESDPWSEQKGRPRASSAGAEQTATAKDRREKYKRTRSEKIVLEPTKAESAREILYL